MKRAIVDYILLDKEERQRVNIKNVPKQTYTPSIIRYADKKTFIGNFSNIMIITLTINIEKNENINILYFRAPVPWRNSFLVSKQFCRHNLFTTNPVLLK